MLTGGDLPCFSTKFPVIGIYTGLLADRLNGNSHCNVRLNERSGFAFGRLGFHSSSSFS